MSKLQKENTVYYRLKIAGVVQELPGEPLSPETQNYQFAICTFYDALHEEEHQKKANPDYQMKFVVFEMRDTKYQNSRSGNWFTFTDSQQVEDEAATCGGEDCGYFPLPGM